MSQENVSSQCQVAGLQRLLIHEKQETLSCWWLRMSAVLSYAELRPTDALKLSTMNVIAGLISESAERGALRHLWQVWLGIQ